MRTDELIPFRAEALPGQKYGVNLPLYFSDGTRGIIRSLLEVEAKADGKVYVVGTYRTLDRAKEATTRTRKG